MRCIIITGSGGLIGSESAKFFLTKGFTVIGIDNNYRETLFGPDGSVKSKINDLISNPNYIHHNLDIRNNRDIELIFSKYNTDIECVIHCAAQPSHDWAAQDVLTDYNINSTATLNLLECTRKHCIKSTFIFMSTNKVYGDNPNRLHFIELDTRWELDKSDILYRGINESFSIDGTKHSLFGCSKLSADLYVQEYARYYGMNTIVLRGGCLTGSKHSGTQAHGFLNYLVKCNLKKDIYNIFGYKGKQVRDNIHSSDLIKAFDVIITNPKPGVFNIGGNRYSNCSILEAFSIVKNITGIDMKTNYVDENRIGDHIWWISDISKFKQAYPAWTQSYNLEQIIHEIVDNIEL